MKNMFLLLVLSAVLFSCSKDADDTDSGLQNFTVVLNVDPNYRFSEFTKSFHAFLSDQNGTILDSAEMQIGQSATLKFTGEPSTVYDLSYMYYANVDIVGEEFYTLITFTNIKNGVYTIGPSPCIENTHDEIYINLDNTGYPCEVTSSTSNSGTFGPENGGYYKFRGNLAASPISDIYVSFKSPNDQFDRYFWRQAVPEGSVFNIDYNTLPEIQNIVNVQSPSNTIFGFGLEGLVNDDNNEIHHSIREGNYSSGNASLSIPVPTNVFDSYIFRLSFGNDNFQYFRKLRTTTIPNNVAVPGQSFIVNNQSPANFSMTINGNAILYDVIFRGTNASETISVAHQVYGEVATEVSFSKENLRKNIQATYSDLTGFETLPLGSVTLTNFSFINSYKDVLRYKIQGRDYVMPELNGFYEGTSKQFD
ncbi:MAG: hypothetical protein JJE55_15350 [Flavobacteriaceae bacterium]|nr:hypothetical protein [Flavobacteriaceae bacterium]